MKRAEQLEIDRITSAIADDGASHELLDKLGAILNDRPDLQDYYSQVMKLHMLLTYELGLSLQELRPVIPNSGVQATSSEAKMRMQQPSLLRFFARNASTSRRHKNVPTHLRRWRRNVYATAAILALISGGYGLWLINAGSPARSGAEVAVSGMGQEMSDLPTRSGPNGFVVRDLRTMKLFSRLTKTALLTSLLLPNCESSDSQELTLCSGVAWMERSPGGLERGHLIALSPGQFMDVYVDTDASGQNSLAVVEIDRLGQTTGATISFNNLVDGDLDETQRRAGCIGNYSVFNDSSFTKYYLFVGSHVLPQQSVDESWYQSDYRVQYESNDLVAIGWDDSGYTGASDPKYGDYTPDRDYDDIRALVRFSRPGEVRASSREVEYSPSPEAGASVADDPGDEDYVLDVKPGEKVMILVSSSSSLPNSIRVVELPSKRVVWESSAMPFDQPSPTEPGPAVFVIRNYGDVVRQYRIAAQHEVDDAGIKGDWRTTPYKVLAQDDGSVTIGFEDSLSNPALIDWNDLRIYARWFSE